MKNKTSQTGKSSKRAGKKSRANAVDKENEKQEWKESRRVLLVFSLLLLATVGFGAMASYRNLSNLSGSASPNAFPMASPPALPANDPSKEFIYSGSALLATVEPFRQAPSDLAIWRPSSGTWYILNSLGQWVTQGWGVGTDIPAPGDFDGDGKTDFCVYRPGDGVWYIINSSSGGSQYISFGTSEDKPAVADYDGDGRSDIAVWRPSVQTWYILQSFNNSFTSLQFGASGDKPVPGDFDGDGKADFAIWRNSSATFWVQQTSNSQAVAYSIGQSGDEPVIGDYDGDGKMDFAVRRASTNVWFIRNSSDANGTVNSVTWGNSSDIAVPARYYDSQDSDAKTDVATWRPSNGVWYIRRSSDLSTRATSWGLSGDIPVPANWNR